MQRRDGKRSRPLTAQHIALVVSCIKDWPDTRRISWEDVVDLAAVGDGKSRYEWGRVALARNAEIAAAYKAKVATFRGYRQTGKLPRQKPPEVEILEERIAALQKKLEEQARVLNEYDDLLVRYLYNAQQHGISQEVLEGPLVPVDRAQTDVARSKSQGGSQRGRKHLEVVK